MSDFKFKPGDLVEVMQTSLKDAGHRFIVGARDFSTLVNDDNSTHMRNTNCYESGIKSQGQHTEFRWRAESELRLVNPDIDDISEMTFREIMDEITETVLIEQ